MVRVGNSGNMNDNALKHEMPPFAMVPRWIIQHEDLTSGAVRVYACLADMASKDRPAWPSHRTLAHKCNMSVSSVRRHIRELIEARAIQVKQRYKPDGEGQTSNLYTVMAKAVDKKVGGATKDSPLTTGDHPPYPPLGNKEEPLNNNHLIEAQKHSETAKHHIKEARKRIIK